MAGSPPRVRGKAACCSIAEHHLGITPACAGKRFYGGQKVLNQRDHPRVCGEKKVIYWDTDSCKGSHPRVRGKGFFNFRWYSHIGITPACAGKSGSCFLLR